MFNVALSFALASAALGSFAQAEPQMTTPLPRDGDIAIKEELCAARRAGTAEAYQLFIARHPGHALADLARRELAELRSKRAPEGK